MTAPGPTLAVATRFWLRLGWISFGGPAGQIALLHRELVERRRWLSERRYLHALNYCLLLPGPEATQLATYLGWLMHGSRGGLLAGGLFLFPSVLVLLGLSTVYALWGQLPLLQAVFWALKPAVLAIVANAAWRLGQRTLHNPLLVAIAVAALAALALGKLPYPLLVVLAGAIGWLGGRLRPGLFQLPVRAAAPLAAGSADGSAPEPIHGDATPTPAHARFEPRRLARTLLLGGLAILTPLLLLLGLDGANGMLLSMARFFSRVALFSFGGAYAVLPYVAQGAVHGFGWLTPAQMVDGLALGETTPGPLIMVVAFVGFLGAWNASASLPYALLAGLVVVWFTFLPSFLFILVGGPLVEASREDLRLGPPMTAITAALVGVIASLALYFAVPVLWPGGRFDPLALLLAALALLLLRRGFGVLPLIGGAGLVGLLRFVVSLAALPATP
ncbi:MAG: chromate efflux transporter [Cyanobacteriota bacterium]